MGVEVEVFGPEEFYETIIVLVVDENCAEQRFFGVDVMRE